MTLRPRCKIFLQEEKIARVGEPEDIAAMVAFILSEPGRLLHGSLIDMDAGSQKRCNLRLRCGESGRYDSSIAAIVFHSAGGSVPLRTVAVHFDDTSSSDTVVETIRKGGGRENGASVDW